MIVIHKKYKPLKIIEALFRLYLPLCIFQVSLKVLIQLPFEQKLIICSIVAAVYLLSLISYCSHNLVQGYRLLSAQEYKKIKFISWGALIIGLIYCWDRASQFLNEIQMNGINKRSAYFFIFFILLLLILYKDILIVKGKSDK